MRMTAVAVMLVACGSKESPPPKKEPPSELRIKICENTRAIAVKTIEIHESRGSLMVIGIDDVLPMIEIERTKAKKTPAEAAVTALFDEAAAQKTATTQMMKALAACRSKIQAATQSDKECIDAEAGLEQVRVSFNTLADHIAASTLHDMIKSGAEIFRKGMNEAKTNPLRKDNIQADLEKLTADCAF